MADSRVRRTRLIPRVVRVFVLFCRGTGPRQNGAEGIIFLNIIKIPGATHIYLIISQIIIISCGDQQGSYCPFFLIGIRVSYLHSLAAKGKSQIFSVNMIATALLGRCLSLPHRHRFSHAFRHRHVGSASTQTRACCRRRLRQQRNCHVTVAARIVRHSGSRSGGVQRCNPEVCGVLVSRDAHVLACINACSAHVFARVW